MPSQLPPGTMAAYSVVSPFAGFANLRDGKLSDLTLNVPGGLAYRAHRAVLAAHMTLFNSLYQGPYADSCSPEFDFSCPEVAATEPYVKVLELAYGQDVQVVEDELPDLFALARYYGLEYLETQLLEVVVLCCRADNCLGLLSQACSATETSAKRNTLAWLTGFVEDHFSEVAACKGLWALDAPLLEALFASDRLSCRDEYEVFRCVWAGHVAGCCAAERHLSRVRYASLTRLQRHVVLCLAEGAGEGLLPSSRDRVTEGLARASAAVVPETPRAYRMGHYVLRLGRGDSSAIQFEHQGMQFGVWWGPITGTSRLSYTGGTQQTVRLRYSLEVGTDSCEAVGCFDRATGTTVRDWPMRVNARVLERYRAHDGFVDFTVGIETLPC